MGGEGGGDGSAQFSPMKLLTCVQFNKKNIIKELFEQIKNLKTLTIELFIFFKVSNQMNKKVNKVMVI